MKRLFLLSVFLVGVLCAWAADTIPAARMVPLVRGSTVGVKGGIPSYTVVNVTGLDDTGATDVSGALQAIIDASPESRNLRLPVGLFRIDYPVYIDNTAGRPKNIVVSGTTGTLGAQLTKIDQRSSTAFSIGANSGLAGPVNPAHGVVSAGISKGSTQITIGDTGWLANGDLIQISAANNPLVPTYSVFLYENLSGQMAKVVSVDNSTQITIEPALLTDWSNSGAQAVIVSKTSVAAANGCAVEDIWIDGANVSGANSSGVVLGGAVNCWVRNVRVDNIKNYPINTSWTVFSEIRHNYIGPRAGGGTNGGGWLLSNTTGALFEDNIVIDNAPLIEVNFGSSGNLIVRNYGQGSYYNTNHAPWNRFNVYLFNVGQGFKSDGYYGGDSEQLVIANLIDFIVFNRFSYDNAAVGNLINQSPASTALGYPNIVGTSYNGTTVNFPTTQWADYGMTGTLTAIYSGTGTGYQVNNGAGYAAGSTVIAADSGTGTILVDDVVTFAGDSRRYIVTSALSGGTFTIGKDSSGNVGLGQTLADNTAISVTSDYALITLTSPYTAPIYSSGEPYFRSLVWDGKYQRVIDTTATSGTMRVRPDAYDYHTGLTGTPNVYAMPALGTTFQIGMGAGGYQERDGKTVSSTILLGNRYVTGEYEGLSGTTLNSEFVETTFPAWVTAEAALYPTATFTMNPFDATTRTTASPSDIPAGYRALYATPPLQTACSVSTEGNRLAITFNKSIFLGAGGSAGFTTSSDITFSFFEISGSILRLTPNRTINAGESFTVSYMPPTGGIVDDNDNELLAFSNFAVSNFSQEGGGSVVVKSMDWDLATVPDGMNEASAIRQKVTLDGSGVATHIAFPVGNVVISGTGPSAIGQAVKVALLDTDGLTVLRTNTGRIDVANDIFQIEISSISLSAGTYTVAIATNGSDGFELLYDTGYPSGTSSYVFITPNYAGWPEATVGTTADLTVSYAVGLRMTLDAVPVTVAAESVIVGTLNVGSITRAP